MTKELELIVAQNIKDLRLRRGLSQAGLGELIGAHQTIIARLERTTGEGHSSSLTTLKKIAQALDTTVSELTKE